MVNLHSVQEPLSKSKAQTLVIFAYKDKDPSLDISGSFISNVRKKFEQVVKEGRFKAGQKETVFFRSTQLGGFENLLIIGLGDKKKITEETLRISGAVIYKTLEKEKAKGVALALETLSTLPTKPLALARALSEGILMASYKYEEMKSKPKEKSEDNKSKDYFFLLKDKEHKDETDRGIHLSKVLSEGIFFARDLGNAPSNYLTPKIFADKVAKGVRGTGIKFKALNKQQIQTLKMGCLLGVGKGSAEEPRFLVLEYSGGSKNKKPFVLVGKGITFDTGGISIKPSAAMEEMKFDMCGGAAVVGAILTIAKLKLKINVVALVPTTENMPGGNAIKPGDVLVAMNGKTVEVNNTDAEGRLILADALVYACEKYTPAAIVDAATLTGACVVALGNVFAGYFCNHDSLLGEIKRAGESSGERLWQLPLVSEYVDDMKGVYADLSNMGSGKGGGASQGAAFLSQFVDEKIPWAHFDIAGAAYNTGGRYPYNPDKGASGSGVRIFTQLAMDMAKED